MGSAKVPSTSSCRRASRAAATFAVAWMALAVPGAYAQDPGVVFEPGSPSDKEYAIPLEEVRRDAGGGRPRSTESLPFGIGLSRRDQGSRGSRLDGAARGRSDSGAAGRQGPGQGDSEAGSRAAGDRLAEAEAAAAGSLWKLGPLLLVLLPGLLVGLLLARRERGQPAI